MTDTVVAAGDKAENTRRVGHLTRLLADAGVVALASLVSPLKSDREIPPGIERGGEVAVHRGIRRDVVGGMREGDPKGLYARARKG
jgi:bifunctional enzyme CysN/CysC